MLSFDLSGKNALVAGSTQGIGLAAAQALATLGASCTLIARNETRLQAAVATLTAHKSQSHDYLVADFNYPEQAQERVSNYLRSGKIFCVLVNNSGGPPAGKGIDAQPEAFLSAFRQHLICNHLLATLLVPGMKAAGYGRIINIISTSVKIPLRNLGVSNAIRGAVASWAKTLSNEIAEYGITVNNVLPGATDTQRLRDIISDAARSANKKIEDIEQELTASIPAKRFGNPEEIAAMVAFLASPAASYVNGTSIRVDGGRTGSI